jgi:sterol desaturase/sphingolipid hydroxylase (fatty acid hydroxylase superfamily)
MRGTFAGILIAFVALSLAFGLVEIFRSRTRRQPIFRRGYLTDVLYWLFTPVVTRSVVTIAVAVAAAPVAFLIYGRVDRETVLAGYGPLSRLPLWQQAILILLIADFVGYWMHRLFHGGRLWRFHAVHHSSTELDWLSSVRVHPLNDVLMRISSTLPLLALGFKVAAVASVLPLLTLFAIMLHANLDWDFGLFRFLIASPCFHRWHHTDEQQARDKNFAGLFPMYDLIFGTFYLPRNRVPERFGTSTPVPVGLLGQLAFPFRKQA